MSTFVTVLLKFWFKKTDHEKNFPMSVKPIYESVEYKPILGYISKIDGKRVLGCNGLNDNFLGIITLNWLIRSM